MITMKTGSRAPVRFVFSDDVSETTITIQADDDSAAIAAKLQRVLDLEKPHTYAAILATGAVGANAFRAPESPAFTPADRAAEEARLAGVQPMGWTEHADLDSLPEA
jgi:hypothetical protein